MRNVFYEDLPETLTIFEKEYRILTDFREWIRFTDMIKSDIPARLKILFLKEMFLEEIDLKEIALEEVFEAINSFLSLAEIRNATASSKNNNSVQAPTISYALDAPFILSAFVQYYRIDLLKIPYLHWWKFKMLLDGLPEEAAIKQRIHYRAVDLSSIKDTAERSRIKKIKKEIAIPEARGGGCVTDGEIGNAF